MTTQRQHITKLESKMFLNNNTFAVFVSSSCLFNNRRMEGNIVWLAVGDFFNWIFFWTLWLLCPVRLAKSTLEKHKG